MKTLALFFTFGTSLESWFANGSVYREINYYRELLDEFKEIYWITYGINDAKYQNQLPDGITILPQKYPLPNFVYSLLIPFIYHRELRSATWLKTNQVLGAWSAQLTKFIWRKSLYLRSGYTLTVSRSHSQPLGLRKRFRYMGMDLIERLAYSYFDVASVTSTAQKDYLTSEYQTSSQKIRVVPNPIDTNLFKPSETHDDLPANKTLELLYVGRLAPEKNLSQVLKALQDFENYHFTIIGRGKLEDELGALVAENDLSVEFIERVENDKLPKYYQQADIYIQPSSYEGNPKTILEAMACGCAVLATDVRGIRKVVEHRKSGWLVEKPQSELVLEGLLKLSKDQDLRRRLGWTARAVIKDDFDTKKVIARELATYNI